MHVLKSREKPLMAFDRAAMASADRREWKPLAVVTIQPGPQSRAQERGLANAGRAEDN
jgi:hypothetical protein